jgi:hypothetical protein
MYSENVSVISFLDAQARQLVEKLSQSLYSAFPVFSEAVTVDTTNEDSWPKVIDRKFKASVGDREIAKVTMEYVNWNPRDGESWSLSVMMMPPESKVPLYINIQYNQTDGYFEVGWYEGEEKNFERMKALLEAM